MAVEWTNEQLEAIETHGGNLLVAAAAGSGKTAVLVERIIRMITDDKKPVAVDRLLVLTFTDAAASEMKRKIADAIDRRLEAEPDNAWLREQSIKVGSAPISTIHSFCSRMLTNNAHLTDLPADFSLIDDTENKVLQERALDTVLESYYNKIDKKDGFRELVTGWGGIKGDDYLRETIIGLHNFTRSLAYPKKWISRVYKDEYLGIAKGGISGSTLWKGLLENEIYKCCVDIQDGLEIIWNMAGRDIPSDHKLYSYYYDMKASFCGEAAKAGDDPHDAFGPLCRLIESFEIKTAPRKTGVDEEVAARISSVRDDIIKENLKRAKELLTAFDDENIVRMSNCAPVVRTLLNIVRGVEKIHQRYKREKSAIDFSDLEHGLFALLCDEKGRDTSLCLKLKSYYHEILIDEFQDTNILQFEIFKRLSSEGGNMFMVGDVKQCIYKFRNADPSIFMNLYKTYGRGEGGRLIRLFRNFRSRREVIDGVNYIFSAIMSEKVGGVDYTEDEYLINGATYPDGDNYDTEVLITDAVEEKSGDATLEGIAKEEIEASNAADRMIEMIYRDKIRVTDKETRELRRAEFGDIAVLCRNKKECNLVEEALSERGISSISESGLRYLDSIEVTTVLSFLQIIDNPLQDIPLIAVMRSALFKFSAEELAQIRACEDGRFYKAVVAASEHNEKAADFLAVLRDLRKCAKYMGVDELVWKICNELHYFSIAGAMTGGDVRVANLKLLLARCSDYEQGALTGLFNFMRYIEMLRENDKDLAPAKPVTDQRDAVKIMTIHKSKGLEFPIVFLVGTAKKFFLKDVQRSIIWDEKLGIGLDWVDTRQRVRFNLPLKKLIENEMLASLKAEEMRLLYVAMTRAREKLVLSAALSSRENRWKQTEYNESGKIYPVLADKTLCMRDWILGAVLSHPDARDLRVYADRADILPACDDSRFKVSFADGDGLPLKYADKDRKKELEEEYLPDVQDRLSYVYKYSGLANVPVKMSVSELKRRRAPEEDFSTGLLRAPAELLKGMGETSGAERGTITHYVLQHIDIEKTDTQAMIEKQIEEMVQKGIISVAQSSVTDAGAIAGFFSSPLGKRLKNARKYEREFDFYMLISPKELGGDADCDGADDVLLQGIADCFFYEDDGVVLVDYKTDRVGKGGALKRSETYKLQIEYYARGIESILKLPVKEKYLYFLNCGEAIKM